MAKPRRGPALGTSGLCARFQGTCLARCAQPGLVVLERDHKGVVTGGAKVSCGVALDRCRQPHEPDTHRWDYVFTMRGSAEMVAVEVHHAAASEVDAIIAKKAWAEELVARECPGLEVKLWVWIASPTESAILFTRLHPDARRLVQAGISFPQRAVALP